MIGSASNYTSPRSSRMTPSPKKDLPTELSRWTIHDTQNRAYGETAVTASETSTDIDAIPSLQQLMYQSIVSSDFTTGSKTQLPIAIGTVIESMNCHPSSLQADAWKFAIISGNIKLISRLHKDAGGTAPSGVDDIFPFHLAAAHLNAPIHCCGPYRALNLSLGHDYAYKHNVNDVGHTILDALSVSILRSHTHISPELVSRDFNPPNQFPGEETDICGRWDALNPVVRGLFREGQFRIPAKWKHAFCHTSVQAICHSIITVFGSPVPPDIDHVSGLFVRRCTACGLDLKLKPLHTAVITSFYLAHLGMEGETLFGALAVVVCLLALGADASLKATVSVEEILGHSQDGQCLHTSMTAADLMRSVPASVTMSWSQDCQTGWVCLREVLALAEHHGTEKHELHKKRSGSSRRDENFKANSEDASHKITCLLKWQIHDDLLNLPCIEPRIGTLWALIQAEFRTYRRLREGDPWLSGDFLMHAVKTWLQGGTKDLLMPLTQGNLLNSFSRCGWLLGGPGHIVGLVFCPNAEEMCQMHFMNRDTFDRTSLIEPAIVRDLWESLKTP